MQTRRFLMDLNHEEKKSLTFEEKKISREALHWFLQVDFKIRDFSANFRGQKAVLRCLQENTNT